jgi:2-polyprenyl-3-methyl-5-hydroxy-6-metoxy-1,4-benzoquinol methylase
MSVQALREFINRHNASAAGLAALAAALDAHVSGSALNPALALRIQELLATLGMGDALQNVGVQDLKPLLAELRFTLGLEAKLLYPQTRQSGWNHVEADFLQSAGDVSAGFVQPLARMVVPNLEGLSERLSNPGGAFLDIGVGVASLSIAVARTWPQLRVVGIDLWQPSLALARDNVDQAGLRDRIELREQGAENLTDEAAFDLVWVPIPFIPERLVRAVYERAQRALRPGGWMLISASNPNVDPQSAALWRLRSTLFGNGQTDSGPAEKLLRDVGLTEVRTLPSAPGAFIALVAGRRGPA